MQNFSNFLEISQFLSAGWEGKMDDFITNLDKSFDRPVLLYVIH